MRGLENDEMVMGRWWLIYGDVERCREGILKMLKWIWNAEEFLNIMVFFLEFFGLFLIFCWMKL